MALLQFKIDQLELQPRQQNSSKWKMEIQKRTNCPFLKAEAKMISSYQEGEVS